MVEPYDMRYTAYTLVTEIVVYIIWSNTGVIDCNPFDKSFEFRNFKW
jgi:hypothetical protein